MPAPELGTGTAPSKMAASGVASLFREKGRSVASSRALSFVLLVFVLVLPFFVSVNVFEFCEASTLNVIFSKNKKK